MNAGRVALGTLAFFLVGALFGGLTLWLWGLEGWRHIVISLLWASPVWLLIDRWVWGRWLWQPRPRGEAR